MSIASIISSVDNFVWGPILVIFSLGSGLLFSIALKFPQIRLFKEMLNVSFKNKKAGSGLHHFKHYRLLLVVELGLAI